MKIFDVCETFLRHTTLACAWAIGIGCIGEILAPGSVLSHVNFFWFAVPVLVGSIFTHAPASKRFYPAALLSFIPLSLFLLGFLWTRLGGGGMSSFLLFAGAILLAILSAFAFSTSSSE